MKKRYILGLLLSIFIHSSHAEELTFEHGDNVLSGQFFGPTNGKSAKAVILFVHGDGAANYNAEGFYEIIWEPLRENGYAVFSWDKPNVGQSSGNWLKQSMIDRQNEVLAATNAVQAKYGFSGENTGLLGFSQAGWVAPAVARHSSKIGFVIGVGFATNWVEQGRYFTRVKYSRAGKSTKQIEKKVSSYNNEIQFLKTSPSYTEYSEFIGSNDISQDRFEFIKNNFQADATQDLEKLNVPGLLLWGEDDLNVNAEREFEVWNIRKNPMITTKLIANASHNMLDSTSFDTQEITLSQWLKIMWFKQDALSDDFMPTLIAWLEEREFNT
ncbi:alpha/beta hydrolase family protein [Veronia pacifica]|uniref:Serine aminopeptidase S33 domain-containing protein n=1 Tax=Veronia pacifica TaxID=1080227 RepID=A0A1C3E883_9GAMM|nr:alpha/beta hydrolase [Veronia pacifica]ODA29442.1 hypothetical protein A8L45_22245 [Veronia pacifica]